MDPQTWRRSFNRGVEHFNARRFYEAHEDWEDLWNEAEGDQRLWLQGLIQYAAAFVHFDRGCHATGFQRLMAQATAKVADYEGPTEGIHWERFQADIAPWIAYAANLDVGAPLGRGAPPDRPRIGYGAADSSS